MNFNLNRRLSCLMAAAGLMTLTALPAAVQAQTVLKLAHVAPEEDTQQKAAEFFAEKVAAYSDGALKVRIFSGGALGNDQQIISGVRAGMLDLCLTGNPNYTGLAPKLSVFELPYIFANSKQAHEVLDGDIGKESLGLLKPHGMEGLAFWEVGFRAMTNSKHPIKAPADVKGLKMRTNSNKQLIEYFQLLGANTVPMPLGELYTALETGTVDAQDHPISIVWSTKMYEVQKHLSLTNQAYTALILAMNEKKFSGLDDKSKDALRRAAQEAAVYQRELNAKQEADIIKQLKEHGMEVVENVDLAAFQKVAEPIRDSYVKQNGSDLLDKIDAAIKR